MMTDAGSTWVVVGSSGFVGSRLMEFLGRDNPVLGTTRNPKKISEKRIFLDLKDFDFSNLEGRNIRACIFCAMRTNYKDCAQDEEAKTVNTVEIPLAVKKFLEREIPVIFLSSNAVFGGNRPFCNEDEEPTPQFAYAEHKALAEAAIVEWADRLGARSLLSIVRLTKVQDHTVPPVPQWLNSMRAGEDIEAFEDFIFAPITPKFVADSLVKVNACGRGGIYHLSGSSNLSYFEFARLLASRSGAKTRVIATRSTEQGNELAFSPKYSAIGMKNTRESLQIGPMDPSEVVESIMQSSDE